MLCRATVFICARQVLSDEANFFRTSRCSSVSVIFKCIVDVTSPAMIAVGFAAMVVAAADPVTLALVIPGMTILICVVT